MSLFAVERRLPSMTLPQVALLQAALTDASRRLASRGEPVRYLGCMYLPERGRALCLFEATSREAVRRVNDSAQAPVTSIDLAIDMPARDGDPGA
jgi:hypothetical protein